MSTPPTRWGVSDAAGAQAAIAKLAAAPTRPRAVLFTATPVDGVPWCPDCARTLAGVRKAVAAANGALLEVEVTRPEWKDPARPSPLRAAYGLSGIPSLALVTESGAVGRVLGAELEGARDAAAAEAVKGGKKGGGGGGGNKKGPSTLIPKEKPPYADVGVVMTTLLLVESYRRATGRALLGSSGDDGGDGLDIADAPRALFEVPGVAVLSHDGGQDPKFTYANAAALSIFQAEKWGDLVGMHSRLSAEEDAEIQADRAALLASAAASPTGAVSGYKGWRVGRAGRRFEIQDGTLWQVVAPSGDTVGQAVVFSHVKFEDGSEWGAGAGKGGAGEGGGAGAGGAPAAAPPDPAALEAARAAVASAAAAVRALKEGKGLTNQDEEVVEAVDELLSAKAALAALEDSGGARS